MAASGAIRAGRAFVEIGVIDKTSKILNNIGRNLGRLGTQITSIGRNLIKLGTVMAGAFALSARSFANFETVLLSVSAKSQATRLELAALSEEFRRLGRSTTFTAVEVAQLGENLARLGFDPTEIISMTEAILNLARATGAELADAALITGQLLNQFGLDASEAGRATDALTTTVNNSAATLDQLATSMGTIGRIFASFGISPERALAFVGTLRDFGLEAARAARGLRRMVQQTIAFEERFNEIGVSVRDTADNLLDPMKILNQVLARLDEVGVGSADRLKILEELYGTFGVTVAAALDGAGDAVDELEKKNIELVGSAARTRREMESGLGGATKLLISAFTDLRIEIGARLTPTLKRLFKQIVDVFNTMREFIKNNEKMVINAAKLSIKIIALGGAFVTAGVFLTGLSAAIGAVLSSLGTLITLATSTPIAIGLITTAVAALSGKLDGLAKIFNKLTGDLIPNLSETLGELKKTFTDTFDTVKNFMTGGEIEKGFESIAIAAEIANKKIELSIQKTRRSIAAGIIQAPLTAAEALTGRDIGGQEAFEKRMEGLKSPREFGLERDIKALEEALIKMGEAGKKAFEDATGRVAGAGDLDEEALRLVEASKARARKMFTGGAKIGGPGGAIKAVPAGIPAERIKELEARLKDLGKTIKFISQVPPVIERGRIGAMAELGNLIAQAQNMKERERAEREKELIRVEIENLKTNKDATEILKKRLREVELAPT